MEIKKKLTISASRSAKADRSESTSPSARCALTSARSSRDSSRRLSAAPASAASRASVASRSSRAHRSLASEFASSLRLVLALSSRSNIARSPCNLVISSSSSWTTRSVARALGTCVGAPTIIGTVDVTVDETVASLVLYNCRPCEEEVDESRMAAIKPTLDCANLARRVKLSSSVDAFASASHFWSKLTEKDATDSARTRAFRRSSASSTLRFSSFAVAAVSAWSSPLARASAASFAAVAASAAPRAATS